MSATDAATNRVTLPASSHSREYAGSAVNTGIPVGSMEQWRREAIQKVIGFSSLAPNWDAQGSKAPSWGVRQRAIDVLLLVPGEVAPGPAIVPVSGGGYHFEWSAGNRELEISIDAEGRIETLRVEHGMPLEEEASHDLPALFGWLASQ